MNRIKTMIVDDSAVVRRVLSAVLETDPAIEVIGTTADPLFAIERMKRQWPDVIVLDVEMPRMDGITFLKKIMRERPTPVIICSALTERSTRTSMEALAAGAVEVITKPKVGVRDFLSEASRDLISAVKVAARAKVSRPLPLPLPAAHPDTPAHPLGGQPALTANVELHVGHDRVPSNLQIVAIGTSTGGTQALEVVLSALPACSPGIVVVQHMPEKFTAAFAARLDSVCQMAVREAQQGDRVQPGLALIAPGGKHMQLRRSGDQYHVDITDGPLVNRHRPSVDVLFRSVAKHAAQHALGIIMTGMGNDGAEGLLEMHNAGARTLAQDEPSCVVYGMPKEAVRRGGVDKILPLTAIANEVLQRAPGPAQ